MGGTFDPVHHGHLVAASEVAHDFALDEVVFVPTGEPYQKDYRVVSPAEDRYLMTVIATASNPEFSVSRVDIDRPGPTYTIDTLRDLRAAAGPQDELFFITGADALARMLTWHDVDELFTLAHFVGCTRPGHRLSGAGLPDGKVSLVEIPALAISSTECRVRVEAGEPVWYLVPDGVVQYIAKRDLYAKASEPARERVEEQRPTEGGRSALVTATPRAVELVETAALAAADKLADGIIAYDVSDQLVITDAFLLCSASNDRQVRSIVDEIELRMRQAGAGLVRREGEREGRWVLLDYLDVVIHVQHSDERTYYALERIWKDCPQIPLPELVINPGRTR